MSVSFALNGYQPQTLQVRTEAPPQSYGDAGPARLQPNPVYAELQPVNPPAKKKPAVKRKQTAEKAAPAPAQPQTTGSTPATTSSASPSSSYPWPDPR
jgi:hypothetical protein